MCDGPLIWYDAVRDAVLYCARCGYIVVTGNWNDADHAETPVLKEGLA